MKKTSSSEKITNVSEAPAKLNASQKLQSLEDQAIRQANQIQIMAEEIDRLGSVIQALAKRINAIVRTGDEGQQIGSKQINNLLIEDAAKELANKTQYLIDQGVLTASQGDVGRNSFVVGQEIDSESNVVNPRVQFAVLSLDQDAQDKVIGKKLGELISGDDGVSMEILEIYDIVEKKQE